MFHGNVHEGCKQSSQSRCAVEDIELAVLTGYLPPELRVCLCAEPWCPLSTYHFKSLSILPSMIFMDEQARSMKISHCHSPLNLPTF